MDLIRNKKQRRLVMLLVLLLAIIIFFIATACGVYDLPAHEFLERPEGMPLFGFFGCWALIIMAKIIMTPLLQRDEDYYDKGDDQDV